MKKFKFSLIIPVYNVEKYLHKTIESALNQEGSVDYEIICVNDCSTDNSLELLKTYSDNRLKIIDLKENVGLGEARNVGVRKAKGEFLCMLDGDDWLDVEYFKKLDNIVNNNNVDEIMISFTKVTDRGDFSVRLNKNGIVDSKYSYKIVSACLKIIRKEKYVEFLPKIKYEDLEVTIRKIELGTIKKIYILDEPLYFYNQIRENNIMSKVHTEDILYILNTIDMKKMSNSQKTLILELFFDRFCLYGILGHNFMLFKELGKYIFSNNVFLLFSKYRIGFFYRINGKRFLNSVRL